MSQLLPFKTFGVFSNRAKNLLGNTSSVFELETPISTDQMQLLAGQFWQPASTYLWKEKEQWCVRWFAPDAEIGVCGHGALAAMAYLSTTYPSKTSFVLKGEQTEIIGGSHENGCYIELPAFSVTEQLEVPAYLRKALGIPVLNFFKTENKHIVLTDSENSVREMVPDFGLLRTSDVFGYIVTAEGNTEDFVSRTLVPHVHQLEDPATGSSHAALAPFWSKKTNMTSFVSKQLSSRGGYFQIEVKEKSVILQGEFNLINQGEAYLS